MRYLCLGSLSRLYLELGLDNDWEFWMLLFESSLFELGYICHTYTHETNKIHLKISHISLVLISKWISPTFTARLTQVTFNGDSRRKNPCWHKFLTHDLLTWVFLLSNLHYASLQTIALPLNSSHYPGEPTAVTCKLLCCDTKLVQGL